MYKRFLLGLVLLLCAVSSYSQSSNPPEFLVPTPGYDWSFPRDHANHSHYALEWWYYTGHLLPAGQDPNVDANWAHLQLTFFRSAIPAMGAGQLYFGHLAISGLGNGFQYAEKIARGTLGEAGSEDSVQHVWIDTWRASLMPDGSHVLEADADDVGAIRLIAKPALGPVLNGDAGFSKKGPGGSEASYYYSMPRMDAEGWLYPPQADNTSNEADPIAVTGLVWMDHEFGNQQIGEGLTGWDWWGLKLPGGEALMLYRIRREDGQAVVESEGTFTASDGSTIRIPFSEIEVEVTGTWISPHTGVTYPSGWTLSFPEFVHPLTGKRGMSLTIIPIQADQELRTESSTRVTYYEGAVRVVRDGYQDRSFGYVELVGYDAEQDKAADLNLPVSAGVSDE
jgi:predicted secreted hydrolase